MDIDEYKRKTQPKARRLSRLDPFRTQIFDLRESGYALDQIAEWLVANGLTITSEAIRKYVKKHEGQMIQVAKQPAPAALPPAVKESEGQNTQGENGAALSENQRRDKAAEKYINPETTNPLLRRKKEKKQ